MKSKMFLMLSLMLLATPAFAQGAESAAVSGNLTAIGAIVGLAISAGLCGLGQGKAVAAAVEAVARNPGAAATIQTLMFVGLAFIESLTIFTLLIVFLKA